MKKTSSLRHSPRNASQWATIVTEAESTQMPLAQFCEEKKVSLCMLQRWRQKLKNQVHATSFLPVRVIPASSVGAKAQASWQIDVVLTNERRIKVAGYVDLAQLRQIAEALESGVSC